MPPSISEDVPAAQATLSASGIPNFFVSNVNDMSDSYDATTKHVSGLKAFKVQEKGADGTWKLEWTFADAIDANKEKLGVAFRVKVGDKLYDCGSNGLTDAAADAIVKACTSIKAL